MYLQRFGLRSLPFRLSPDSEFVFPSASHSLALDTLRTMLSGPGGITLMTGPSGVGKTTLIDRMLLEVPASTAVARLNQGLPSAIALLQGLLMQFGYAPFHLTRAELGSALHTFLAERDRMAEPTLVIVDEAQRLDGQALVELMQATNPYASRLHLLLVGNGELAECMESTAMAPAQAAVRLRITLAPLRPDEVARYLQHRLDKAGAGGKRIFDDGAVDMLMRVTGGLPKYLNKLADGAMTSAYQDGRDLVRSDDVLAASRLLGTIEHSQRRAPPAARTPPPALMIGATEADVLRSPKPEDDARSAPPSRPLQRIASAGPAAVESDAPSQAGSNSPTPTSTSSVATEALETAAAREASSPSPLDAVALSQIASNESATDDKEDRSPAAAPTFRVHLHHDGDFIETVQLLLGELSVGRTRDNDLQIESRYISRRHCKLLLTAAGLSVEDLGSTNGTFVNGAEARRQTLHHGDTVRIGLHELRVDVSLPLD